jgi:hypothetical protein
MEVSGQPHASVALARGKSHLVSIGSGGWVGLRAGLDTMEKRKILSLPGNEPRSSGPETVATLTKLCRLQRMHKIEFNIKIRGLL